MRRQIAFDASPGEHDEAERQRLVQLLGRDGSLEELNRLLCSRIRAGDFGLSNRKLMDHLWATTLDKVAVDQPNYASYQRSLAERGDSR